MDIFQNALPNDGRLIFISYTLLWPGYYVFADLLVTWRRARDKPLFPFDDLQNHILSRFIHVVRPYVHLF